MAKSHHLKLEPKKDHEAIVRYMVVHACPFDFVRSIEIALLKTFSIPSIAEILVNSGKFINRTQKRYDDTDLLLSLFIENGYSSKRGLEAIKKINRMHAKQPITNDQMLYVLTTFVVEPILWMKEFGVRQLHQNEQEALFYFWIEVGRRMGIKELFSDLSSMKKFHEDYEAQFMQYHEFNARLYQGVLPTVARMMPWPLGKITPSLLTAVMSPRLCRAFGLKPAPNSMRFIAKVALKLRAYLGYLTPTKGVYRTDMHRPTYPEGFQTKDLGTNS